MGHYYSEMHHDDRTEEQKEKDRKAYGIRRTRIDMFKEKIGVHTDAELKELLKDLKHIYDYGWF